MPNLKNVVFIDGKPEHVLRLVEFLSGSTSPCLGRIVRLGAHRSTHAAIHLFDTDRHRMTVNDLVALHRLNVKQVKLIAPLFETVLIAGSPAIELERFCDSEKRAYPQALLYQDFRNFHRDMKEDGVRVYYIHLGHRQAKDDFRDRWFTYGEPTRAESYEYIAGEIINYISNGLEQL